jgi:hypothetical protein
MSFEKNLHLENILKQINGLLETVEKEQMQLKGNDFSVPSILQIGSPRSGTTFFTQWMASHGVFSNPTNFLSRFYGAPYIGALIYEMLVNPEYDFGDEFCDVNSNINFNSNLGKSKGALATNEFQHFFRNYMPNFDPEYLDENTIEQVDFKRINSGIATIEQAFNKPFITKAMMLQFNIEELFRYNPKSIFFFIKRAPLLNMQSIYLARKEYYNDVNIWWSVKPKEFDKLKGMDIYHQIAGQVFFTNKAIESAFEKISASNKIVINYEQFCKKPAEFYEKTIRLYALSKYKINSEYNGSESFIVSDNINIPNDEIKKFEKAYKYFSNEF